MPASLPSRLLGIAAPISTATMGAQAAQSEHITKEGMMYHFATALIAGTTATVLISGIAFMPVAAEAAKLSKAEMVVLEKATAACKVQAKGMKFNWHWRKRQKYVRNCIIRRAVRIDPTINISEVAKTVNMMDLPMQKPGEWGCDPIKPSC
jgi:hypothetical protein